MTKLLETNPNEYYERLKQWAIDLGLDAGNIKRQPAVLVHTIGGFLYKHDVYVRTPKGELVSDRIHVEAVADTVHVPVTYKQAEEARELGLVDTLNFAA